MNLEQLDPDCLTSTLTWTSVWRELLVARRDVDHLPLGVQIDRLLGHVVGWSVSASVTPQRCESMVRRFNGRETFFRGFIDAVSADTPTSAEINPACPSRASSGTTTEKDQGDQSTKPRLGAGSRESGKSVAHVFSVKER